MVTSALLCPQSIAALYARFLDLLPRIELHGRIFFRYVKCPHEKADAIAEMVALAWKWYVRLAQRGKDAADFVVPFCRFAGFAVKSGRRLCGQEKPKDTLSPRAQMDHNFAVEKLTNYSTLKGNPLSEALTDNRITPPPDAAAFRIDFRMWLRTRSDRDRRIIQDLMVGERTLDVSRKYSLCPGRVSQLRQEFHRDWLSFNGEASEQQLTYSA